MRKILFLILSMLLPLAAWSADDSSLMMKVDAFIAGEPTEMAIGLNNVPLPTMVNGDEETEIIGDPIALNPQSGADLSAVLSEAMAANPKPQSISIALAAGGEYTVSAPLKVGCSLTIVGAGPELAVIDASALEDAMILMSDTPYESSLNELEFYAIGDIRLANVSVKGLKQPLFYANKVKYLIPNFIIDNSIVQVAGGNKTIINTNSGGVIGKLLINNSTIYSNPAHEGQLYSSQSGQKATDAGLEVQTLSLQNSTFYNISLNKNVCTHRSSNQTWLAYDVQNCLVVDCGKDGQFIKGLNGGQSGKNPTWIIKHNSFQRTAEDGSLTDISANESTGDEDEPVQDNVEGVVKFVGDIAMGDFTMGGCPQNTAKIGDPRWIDENAVEEILIEMDVTSDFNVLTQYTNWVGASGYATWAAPKVMTNAGDEVYMCERYDVNCYTTGDVMYQTVTGLTPGKYRFELYGSAAFTFGRGFDSGAFSNEDTPEDPLTSNTGILLYAETSNGTVSQEIAAYKATSFSEVSTAVLDGVVVSEDGSVKLGMSKSTNYTNWHIIQLKGVTALVNAHEYWMGILSEAETLAAEPMNGEVLSALSSAMVDDSGFKSTEDYMAAIEALRKAMDEANISIAAYATTAEALALYGEKAAALDEAGQAAYDVSAVQNAYNERTMIDDMTDAVKAAYIAAVKAQTTPGVDMTEAGSTVIGDWIGSTGAYQNIYAERFGQEMGEGDIMYQTVTGMQQGTYKVELYAVASQAWNEAATGDGITEAYANDATAPLTVIAQTACDPAASVVTLEATVDESGNLKMGMRNLTNGGNWFVIQLKSISLVELKSEEIFIEMDVTSDFNALTQYTNWVGASGYATWAAPKVMTNAGDEVYMCERYDVNCDNMGDVMYQTVSGLTPGKYRIELYGSAAYTFGRGFDSGAFSSDDTPEDPLMENTGVTLYAETSEGTISQEIAAYKATTFSEVSTALLDGIVVGEDGSVRLGMNKSTNYTNWHIIQLKGVTALVNAHEYWMNALAGAEEVAAKPMNGEVLAALRAAMVDDSGFKSAEEYMAAIEALQRALAEAQSSISAYAATADALALYGEKAAALDEAGQAAYDVTAIQAAYDGRTMVDDMSEAVVVAYIAAVKAQTTPGADMTEAGSKEIGDWIGSTGAYNGIYAERFGQEMGEGVIMYQTITGMQQGTYKVELYAVASQAWNEAATGEGITEAYANDATAPLTVIAQTACDPAESVVTLEGYVDENGELTMGMRNLTNGGNWFVIQLKSISLISLGENSINELTVNPFEGAEGIYNLNGQKVDTPTRGIYIVNGKKVVVK